MSTDPSRQAVEEPTVSQISTPVGTSAEDVEKGAPSQTTYQAESDSSVTKLHEHTIPEGGWKAWSTVAGAWLVMVTTFGYMSSFGIFETLYVEALLTNYSTSDIGWIGGVQIFLLFGIGGIAGKVFDAQHFRIPMLLASIVHVGCTFALSACQPGQYYQFFLAQGLGQGLAMGMMYLPALAITSHYFSERRALAMGIVLTGSSIGSIVIPILLNNVLQTSGYVWAIRACGFFLLALLIPANLLMFPNFNPVHKTMEKVSVLQLFTERVYIVGLIAAFFTNLGLFFPSSFLQLWAETEAGVSQNLAFYMGAVMNAAGILGRLAPNYLADRYGPVTCQVPSQFICVVLIFAFFGLKNTGGVVAFSILYGIASGAVYSLFAPMLAVMAHSMAEVGVRLGVASIVLGIAGLIGNPISGALIGNAPHLTWWKAIVFNGVVLGIGASLMIPLRYLLQIKKGKRWV